MPSAREYHLLKKYGITEKTYDAILSQQKGRCAVCQRNSHVFAKRLCVDHDHRTGRIRGLLCFFCNKFRVGRWKKEDLPTLRRMIKYLSQDTGLIIPKRKRKR